MDDRSLREEMECQKQAAERQNFGLDHSFEHMPFFPVADLMREHRKDFVLAHLLDQGIEQDDPLDPADTGEIRVRVAAPAEQYDHAPSERKGLNI